VSHPELINNFYKFPEKEEERKDIEWKFSVLNVLLPIMWTTRGIFHGRACLSMIDRKFLLHNKKFNLYQTSSLRAFLSECFQFCETRHCELME